MVSCRDHRFLTVVIFVYYVFAPLFSNFVMKLVKTVK